MIIYETQNKKTRLSILAKELRDNFDSNPQNWYIEGGGLNPDYLKISYSGDSVSQGLLISYVEGHNSLPVIIDLLPNENFIAGNTHEINITTPDINGDTELKIEIYNEGLMIHESNEPVTGITVAFDFTTNQFGRYRVTVRRLIQGTYQTGYLDFYVYEAV